MKQYLKAFAAAASAAGAALLLGLDDGSLSSDEIGLIVGAFAGGFGFTWAVPAHWLRYGKAIVSGLVTGVAAALAALDDGAISGNEWYTISLALVGGLAAFATPNRPAPA